MLTPVSGSIKSKETSTSEELIKQMRTELLVMGFAVAKEIARLKTQTCGTMVCPLCQQILKFSTAASNNHFAATCVTADCINMRE